MSDMEYSTRDKPLFQARRNCPAQHSPSSSPGNDCRGVWSQPFGNVRGSPSDERGAQINGHAKAAASVAVHAAAHPISRFQDGCLHSTPLQIQNNELIARDTMIRGSPGDEQGSLINGNTEASASAAAHTASNPVSRLQNQSSTPHLCRQCTLVCANAQRPNIRNLTPRHLTSNP